MSPRRKTTNPKPIGKTKENAKSYITNKKGVKRLRKEIEKLEEENPISVTADASLAPETITELSIELGELSKTIEEKTRAMVRPIKS